MSGETKEQYYKKALIWQFCAEIDFAITQDGLLSADKHEQLSTT